MLMRRARAYSSSCSQVILVNLHTFRCILLFCSQKSPKITLKKMNIFRVQGHSRSSMLTFLRSSSPVLVMISSMFVPICYHFHARQDLWIYRVRTWTAKINILRWKFHAQVVLIYLQPFRRNSLFKCVSQPKIAKNLLKASIWGFKVI